MSALARELPPGAAAGPARESTVVRLGEFGERVPLGRPGGQGRVYRPARIPSALGAAPIVVKLYRRPPPAGAVDVLARMIAWSRTLDREHRDRLHRVAAWPLAIVTAGDRPVGIAMHDVSDRFEVPFVMPSGRRQRVLLSLEHLLGADDYLQLRGLGIRLDTTMRTVMAERISGALASLHRHGIVASDIAPNNLLVGFGAPGPTVCFIDCDSMVFHGRQALASVETADWQVRPEFREAPCTRAADAYKLGLVVLRLFARSHDARLATPHVRHVPRELRELLSRSLGADAANRPPAGEWQRALRQLLTYGGLNERYPGPAPIRPSAKPSVPRPPYRHDQPPRRPSPAPTPTRPGGARRSKTHQPFALAWLVVAAVIFLLLLARLLAVASPTSGGAGLGAPGGNQVDPAYHYYYTPAGPGSEADSR